MECGGHAELQALFTTVVAAQAKEREGVISLTLLRASLLESNTKEGETHCSNLLSGSSYVAQRFVLGPPLERLRQVSTCCGSSPSGNLFVGAIHL